MSDLRDALAVFDLDPHVMVEQDQAVLMAASAYVRTYRQSQQEHSEDTNRETLASLAAESVLDELDITAALKFKNTGRIALAEAQYEQDRVRAAARGIAGLLNLVETAERRGPAGWSARFELFLQKRSQRRSTADALKPGGIIEQLRAGLAASEATER